MESPSLSRRHALKTLATGSLLTTVGAQTGLQAAPPPPPAPPAAPPLPPALFYRHRVGQLDVYVLSDGELAFPAHPTFGGEKATAAEVHEVLKSHYRPAERIRAQLNLCLVDDGTTRTLIDTGYGERGREGTGQLLTALAQAGFTPDRIDRVVITHAHPDHLNGVTTRAGEPVFPQAKVIIAETEKTAWQRTAAELAAMEAAGERMAGLFASINEIFEQLDDRLVTIKADAAIAPGLTALPLHGHTPGHIGVMIESAGEKLAVLADAANHEILMTVQPDWPFGFDSDPEAAAKTRRKIFGQIADERILALGYHWSFPGLAYIGRDGDHFRWHPLPWDWA